MGRHQSKIMVLILAVMKCNYSAKKGYLYLTLESRPSFDITKQFRTIGNNLVKGANSKVFALDVEGLPVRFHQLLQLLNIGSLQLSHLCCDEDRGLEKSETCSFFFKKMKVGMAVILYSAATSSTSSTSTFQQWLISCAK